MYRYIECNRADSDEHFKKFKHLDEMKSYIENLAETDWHQTAMNDSIDESYQDDDSYRQNNPDIHVYRIKDIVDAINTSVILDHSQKEDYNRMLYDGNNEFDADVDFLEICDNVGECDIY